MIKKLTKHGNSRAIVIDKSILAAAGLEDNAEFVVTVHPNGGLIIQSVSETHNDVVQKAFDKMNKKYAHLMQRLADL